MQYITLEEILRLHFQIIEDYGGTHGIRDEGRIQSVIAAPAQEVFGQDQYPTVCEKAAVYARNIIADHAFVDGYKRTGITVMGIFLARDNYKLTATATELEDFAVKIAVEHLSIQDIADWLKCHTQIL